MIELPPPHVLARLDAIIVGQESSIVANDEGDLQTVDDDDDRSVSSEALGITSSKTESIEGKRRTNPVVDGQLVPKSGPRCGPMRKRRREEPTAATPPTRARRPRRAVDYAAMNDPGLEDEGDGSD